MICPICLIGLKDAERSIVEINVCHHAYHRSCLLRWMSSRTSCPMCRRDIFDAEEDRNVDIGVDNLWIFNIGLYTQSVYSKTNQTIKLDNKYLWKHICQVVSFNWDISAQFCCQSNLIPWHWRSYPFLVISYATKHSQRLIYGQLYPWVLYFICMHWWCCQLFTRKWEPPCPFFHVYLEYLQVFLFFVHNRKQLFVLFLELLSPFPPNFDVFS